MYLYFILETLIIYVKSFSNINYPKFENKQVVKTCLV